MCFKKMFRFPLKWKGTPVLLRKEITRGWESNALQAQYYYACIVHIPHLLLIPSGAQPRSWVAIIIPILRMREVMFRVTKIPWAGDQCGKILIHSTPNFKWGEESFHRGDRALLETVKGWEGGSGWEASFIHFSGIHQHLTIGPGYYTQTFSSWEYQKYWTVAFLADKREL